MSFLTGITNLTSWMGNVIMPTLAALFFALGVLRFAHGQAHTYTPWAGFLCLMVSGILRGIETFATQAASNDPDLVWITLRRLINWTCNVMLPVYAVLQLLQGLMQYAGNISPVHRNLHTRVSWFYLEFEDWFVVIGLAAVTNVFGRWIDRNIFGIPMNVETQAGTAQSPAATGHSGASSPGAERALQPWRCQESATVWAAALLSRSARIMTRFSSISNRPPANAG
jgi:hypothetical protein